MKFTVDRVEAGIAVLISRDEPPVQIPIPARLLPEGCGEGSIITLTLEREDAETNAARDHIARLQEKLKKSG